LPSLKIDAAEWGNALNDASGAAIDELQRLGQELFEPRFSNILKHTKQKKPNG